MHVHGGDKAICLYSILFPGVKHFPSSVVCNQRFRIPIVYTFFFRTDANLIKTFTQYDDHYALIGYHGKDLIYNPQITCLSQKSPLQNSAGHSTCRKPFNGWFYFKWCQALFTQFRIEIDKYWDEFEMKYFLLVKSSVHSARSRGPNINFVCT